MNLILKAIFQKSEKQTSRSTKNGIAEVGKSDPSYINNNYIDFSNQSDTQEEDIDEIDRAEEQIKERIEYDYLSQRFPYELLNNLINIMLEVAFCHSKTIHCAGVEQNTALVKRAFRQLDESHIEYVIDCFMKQKQKIANVKQYLLTTLYNAPSTIDSYYNNQVQVNR